MCRQIVIRYACDHLIDVPGVERCQRAVEYGFSQCGDIDHQIQRLHENCPDCGAERDTNDHLEAAIAASARDLHAQQERHGNEYEEALAASAREFQAQQQHLGSQYGATDEDDMLQRIMTMSLRESTQRVEAEEQELVRKALEQSRREFDAMPQAMDNWTQRARGYDPDDDYDDFQTSSGMPDRTPVSSPVRPTREDTPRPPAGPSRTEPSSSRPSTTIASSRQTQARPAGRQSETRAQGETSSASLDANAAAAARNRWRDRQLPGPEPGYQPPAPPMEVPKRPNSKPAKPSSNAEGKRPARSQPAEPSSTLSKFGTKMPGITGPKTSGVAIAKKPAPRLEKQAQNDRQPLASGQRSTQPPAPKRPDIPEWGTGTPTISPSGQPILPQSEPALQQQPQAPTPRSNSPHLGTETPTISPFAPARRRNLPPPRHEASIPGSSTDRGSRRPIAGSGGSPAAPNETMRQVQSAPWGSRKNDELQPKVEDERAESSSDDDSPPPSPRTMRARRLAALERQSKGGGY